MNKYFNDLYYYNNDGKVNQFTAQISCADVCKYFIMKSNGLIIAENPFFLFMRDITFSLTVNNDGKIHNINFIDNKPDNYYCKTNFIKSNINEIFKSLHALLEQNRPVLVQTDVHRLPFTTYFQSYDANPAVPGHVFFLIDIDEDNLYYVEAPWNINLENFKQYKDNKSIGVISKKEIIPAFESYVNYITIDIDYNKLKFDKNNIFKLFDSIKANFNLPPTINENTITYYGQNAYEKLISILESGIYKLNDFMPYHSREVYSFIAWKSWEIIHGRQMIEGVLNQILQGDILDKLLPIIKEIISSWKIIASSVEVRNKRHQYNIDDTLIDYFKKAFKEEQILISMLQEIKTAKISEPIIFLKK